MKVVSKMEDLFYSWGEWARQQFKGQTTLGKANHLKKEVNEVIESIESGKIDVVEIADCFGLLFSICDNEKITFDVLREAIYDKLIINKKREWGEKPNSDGSFTHIKKGEEI